jgi:hypothetical protein
LLFLSLFSCKSECYSSWLQFACAPSARKSSRLKSL